MALFLFFMIGVFVQTVRSFFFILWMYTSMIVIGLVALPCLFLPVSFSFHIYTFWLRLVFWGARFFCGLTFEVSGQEHIPDGAFLLASKHHSMVDVLFPWLIFTHPALILKKELASLPFFGWYAVKMQNIVIDRKRGMKALKGMVKEACLRISEGRPVLIFPEGTRTPPGETTGYKPGVSALYQALSVPCLPVVHNAGLFWPAHGIRRNAGIIQIHILPPLPPNLPRKQFMEQLEKRMEDAAQSLHTRSVIE